MRSKTKYKIEIVFFNIETVFDTRVLLKMSELIVKQLKKFEELEAIIANPESSSADVVSANQSIANGEGLTEMYDLLDAIHKSRMGAKKAIKKSSEKESSSSDESEKSQKKKASKPSVFAKSNKVMFIQNFVGASKNQNLASMISSLKDYSSKTLGKSGESTSVFPLYLASEAGFKKGSDDPLLLKIGTSNSCTFGKKCKKKDETDKSKRCTYKHADELVHIVPKALLVNIYEQAVKCDQAGICSKQFYLLRTITITLALLEATNRGCEITF